MKPHPVAATVATLVADRDPQRLAAALTESARLRALLPGGPIQALGRANVAACFRSMFADFVTVQLVESAGEPVADRLLIHYRLHVTQGATGVRKMATPAFTRRRVERLEERIRAIVRALPDHLAACAGVVDLVAGYAFPLPFTVICELLGIPEPDRADLGRWFRTLLAPDPVPDAVAASEAIVGYLTALLDLKRAEPGEDLVTDLVVAAQGGALTQQEMLSTIFQLVVAGHDTTTSLIGNATVALLRHPEQRDLLVVDPELASRVVEEAMRWDAPVPHSTFRYTTEEVRIGDAVIPAYAQVIVSMAAANRDPARYRDPEAFDISRTDGGHLALGHGIHHCLGAPLARLEARIALAALHTRFPAMRLAVDPGELRWGHGDGLVLRGLGELPVLLSG